MAYNTDHNPIPKFDKRTVSPAVQTPCMPFRIPQIRDPLIGETLYMGWDLLVPTAILYPNKGNYCKMTKKIETCMK